ncbi:hypothetical protein K8R04_01500 [Candidatus Uhrbacteria bacterium]|nr:hypothetical protein [Candidatus Uhrbacteria bacterium]
MNKTRSHLFFTAASSMLISALLLSPVVQANTTSFIHDQTGTSGKSKLIQFTSAGHVLGFREDGVIIASGRHMLNVVFLGSEGVSPATDNATNGTGKVSPLSRVTYKNVWDGVNAVYEAGKSSVVKSTYYLDDGLHVDRIRLGYNRNVQIDSHGNLVINYEDGALTESAPIAWQVIAGIKRPVTATYVVHGDKEIGFSIGDYVRGVPVVIDPDLNWNTFLGDVGNEDTRSLAIDTDGNVLVAGTSAATWGQPVRAYTAATDGFAAKLNNSGNLVWNTFLGGTGNDSAYGITVGSNAYVYVSGLSPATWGSPVRAYTASSDAFAVKLDGSGNIVWNTFLGGSSGDSGNAVTVDGSGNVYISGNSVATWGSPVRAYSSGTDGLVVKLDSSGNLTWNTFLGGSGTDNMFSIAVDESGNVYAGGFTDTGWGSPVRAYTSANDGSVSKLDGSGNLTWNTFLGGSGNDSVFAVAVDGNGNVYAGGNSVATWGSPVRAYSSGTDGLVAKLDSSGNLTWNTFTGGSGTDGVRGMNVDSLGNIYVGGSADATWGSPLQAYVAGTDATAVLIDSTGVLTWNTFLGGSGTDSGFGIAVDVDGSVYVSGLSGATWGTPVRSYTSGNDLFVVKLSNFPVTEPIASLTTILAQPKFSADWNATPSYTNVTYFWSLSQTYTAGGADPCLTTNDCFKILLTLEDTGTTTTYQGQEWMSSVSIGDITWGGPLDMEVSSVQRHDTDNNGRYEQLEILVDCLSPCAMVAGVEYSIDIVNSPLKNPETNNLPGQYTSLTQTFRMNDQSTNNLSDELLNSVVAIGDALTVDASVDASLSFSIQGYETPSSYFFDNVDIDNSLASNTCDFGLLTPGTPKVCAWYLNVATNAENGYSVYVVQDQDMTFNGNTIKQFYDGSRSNYTEASSWSPPSPATLAHLGYSSNDASVLPPSFGEARWAGIPTIAAAGQTPVITGLVVDSASPGVDQYTYALKVESAATLPQGTGYTHNEYFIVVGNF